VCFICGIDRNTFDRKHPHGFEYHIQKEHNVWHYLSFIIHLRNKRVTDYTGQEAYVATMLRQGEYGFFPILKASSINYDSVVVTGSGDGRGEVGCTAESLSTGGG
jgi:hypothetical protein